MHHSIIRSCCFVLRFLPYLTYMCASGLYVEASAEFSITSILVTLLNRLYRPTTFTPHLSVLQCQDKRDMALRFLNLSKSAVSLYKQTLKFYHRTTNKSTTSYLKACDLFFYATHTGSQPISHRTAFFCSIRFTLSGTGNSADLLLYHL